MYTNTGNINPFKYLAGSKRSSNLAGKQRNKYLLTCLFSFLTLSLVSPSFRRGRDRHRTLRDHSGLTLDEALTGTFKYAQLLPTHNTHSNTSRLNCFCRFPKNSPIICLLRPFLCRRKWATPTGVSGTKPRSIRYWTPFSGFLRRNEKAKLLIFFHWT